MQTVLPRTQEWASTSVPKRHTVQCRPRAQWPLELDSTILVLTSQAPQQALTSPGPLLVPTSPGPLLGPSSLAPKRVPTSRLHPSVHTILLQASPR
ncbi:unnamed protein product [Gadus morhua 'NCC']